LGVVVQLILEPSGRCSIVAMSQAVNSEDGRSVTRPLFGPSPDPQPAPHDCGELPLKRGLFQILVRPRRREVDSALTTNAYAAALAYEKDSVGPPCALRFPKVKTGDPFFHVYKTCGGLLSGVDEFQNKGGKPANSPHWTYLGPKSLPRGTELRLRRQELWFAEFTSEQRTKSTPITGTPE
jgi:hypothetical protein